METQTMPSTKPTTLNEPVTVTLDNFIRAETDMYFGKSVADGGLGKLMDYVHQLKLRRYSQWSLKIKYLHIICIDL